MTTSLVRRLCAAPSLALLTLLTAGSMQLSAQAPSPAAVQSAPPLRFDVISIRPRQSGDTEPSNRQFLPGGRFVATATTVRTLIRVAFGSDDNRMSGIPSWADSETFDITATTANQTEVKTTEQFKQVMLSLLEDRFQFKFHREQKSGAVYWLVQDKPGKLGPALKPSAADAVPNMSNNSNGSKSMMHITGSTMVDISAALRRQAGRPVEDHTNLPGKYDFQIEWSPQLNPEDPSPSLFTVIKEQLGLKLQSATGTTEMIVVDQLARPAGN